MKSNSSSDSRMIQQVFLLGSLSVLPVIMIALNGIAAIRSLLSPAEVDASPARTVVNESKSSAADEQRGEPLQFGVYDPTGRFAGESVLKIRHLYISWVSFDENELAGQLQELTARQLRPLITIEPWPSGDKAGRLLRDVADGLYDHCIDRLAGALRNITGPVYLCWGHEMDQDLTQRYPWSGADPHEYVAAYRHVVERLREQATVEQYWVWTAVLKEGSLRYWPGDEYADYVGLPIYSFPEWDRRNYGFIRDFRTTFEEKRRFVRQLRKPLIITELGVSGGEDFESYWMHQAFLALDDYADLKAVVFFYAEDAKGAWGSDVSTPDWRVHPDLIRGLVAWKVAPDGPPN